MNSQVRYAEYLEKERGRQLVWDQEKLEGG
jgi:hypothetical protein